MSRIHRPVGPVTADEGKTLETLKNLWPHLWPADRPELKRAVALALAALVLGKVLTVFLPYVYKWSTDLLAVGPEPQKAQLLAVPVLLVRAPEDVPSAQAKALVDGAATAAARIATATL